MKEKEKDWFVARSEMTRYDMAIYIGKCYGEVGGLGSTLEMRVEGAHYLREGVCWLGRGCCIT